MAIKDLLNKVKQNSGAQAPKEQTPTDSNSTANPVPADGQSSAASQAPADSQSSAASQAPADSQSSASQAPADGQPSASQAPADGQSSASQAPADSQSSAASQAPADSQPSASQAPADSQSSAASQAPANNDPKKSADSKKENDPKLVGIKQPNAQEMQDNEPFGSKTISRESASMLNLLMEQIKTLVEVSNNINERTKEVEKRINEVTVDLEKNKENFKIMSEKMDTTEKNMEKFIGLYEVVTNQYNPFLEGSDDVGDKAKQKAPQQPTEQPAPSSAQTQSVPSQAPVAQGGAQVPATPGGVAKPQVQPMQQGQAQAQPVQQGQPQNNAVQQNQAQAAIGPGPIQGASAFNYEDALTGEQTFVPPNYTPQQEQYGSMNQIGGFNQMTSNMPSNSMMQYGANPSQFTQPNQMVGQSQFVQPQNGMQQPFQQQSNSAVPLILPSGHSVTDINGLLQALPYVDDYSFSMMVNQQKNDIANWVMNLNPQLGAELFKYQNKQGMMQALSNFAFTTQTSGANTTGMYGTAQPQVAKTNEFRLANGKSVDNIEAMLDELIYLDDASFNAHVNSQKNDIADWLQTSLQKPDIAYRVRSLHKKSDIIRELAMYVHSGN